MSTVQEILTAMDKLTRDELRIVKLGIDFRLSDDDDDPALLAALKDAIAYSGAHPDEAKSIDEVRALIPNGLPSRNQRTGNSGSCRDRFLHRPGQSRCSNGAWQ